VPAAFCRKAVVSTKEFEVWGDGKQTRSFMFIDDCVEGSIRILLSDCAVPLNLGKFVLCYVPCRVLLCVRCGYLVKACY
jgi:nucleoside-diphosphate-sugar epimerase